MKYLTILVITLLIVSSCGTKKTAVISIKEEVEINKTEEATNTPEQNLPTNVVIEQPIITDEIPVTINQENITKTKATPDAFNHTAFNMLLQKHVSTQGEVNYKAFKTNRNILTNYIKSLSTNTPTNSWDIEDKLAYWINAYNALTIDLIIRHYPTKSIKDIKKPWDQRLWEIGDKWVNLNDIEHQILRKMNEPRIHFAIVCASYSCPKLQNEAYTASDLDIQLTKATTEFLSDTKRNTITDNQIKLSKIFKWFAKDFKQDNSSVLQFVNTYTETNISKNTKLSYRDYNWDLNE